jgi:hypothetical protein
MTTNGIHKPDCTTCSAFAPDPGPVVGGMIKGQCRANPPAAVPVGADQLGRMSISSFWPPTSKGLWCRKWQPNDRAVEETRTRLTESTQAGIAALAEKMSLKGGMP